MKKPPQEQAPLMTIDQLAALMLAKFEEQEARLTEKFDQRFIQQDKKIDQLFIQQDKKFDAKLESLAMMVARGFEEHNRKFEDFKNETAQNFEKVSKKFEEIEGNLVGIRQDIRNMGDRFVSFHHFDQWTHRVMALEAARAKKK